MRINPTVPITEKTARLLAQLLTLMLLALPAFGQPQQGPNGNYYEVVLVPEHITWPQAKDAAEQRTYLGRAGRLATLTSAEEDVFAEYLRQLTPPEGGVQQLWVGGHQLPGSAEPAGGWVWINGEGPISGVNGGDSYTNWQSDQPDDAWGGEHFLAIGLYGLFGWNDDGSLGDGRFDGTLDGYLVEYETVVVTIDIKPGGAINPINLDAPGKVPVAILSSAIFDAATVDRSSITFGRYGLEAPVVSTALSDVNGDKRKDLVCQFNILDAGFLCGDTAGILRGRTTGGTPILGTDSVETKNCPPYDLSIVALQNVNHLTDVELKASVVAPGFAPPTLAQNIVLKSLDLSGKNRWTQTFQNTALTPEGTVSSSVNLQFTDMERNQRVKGQMVVPTGKPGATYVLRQEAVVLLRPDLAVERIDAPASGFVRQVVNIPAYIRELNGDLGATADVSLMEGDTVLDVANNVTVPAHASVAVVFSATFHEAGPHALKVVIGNPGDYDPSNNEGNANIEIVVPALQTADYSLSYNWNDYDYLDQSSSPYWITSYSEKGKNESLYQSLYLPVGLEFPIDSVQFQARAAGTPQIDFEIADLPASYSYGDGYYRYQYGFADAGNGFYVDITSTSGSCCGSGFTSATVSHYAADYVVFSSYHDLISGATNEYTYENAFGTFVNATSQIDTRFIVSDDAGAFGGNASMGLSSYPYDYPWDYEYDSGYGYVVHYEGHSRGTQVSGYSSGQTTP